MGLKLKCQLGTSKWTTFPTTPFPLCFYLKWASRASLHKMRRLERKQQSCCVYVWKVGAGGPGRSWALWFLSRFISLAQGSCWAYSCSTFPWHSCGFSDSWTRCVVSSIGREPTSADQQNRRCWERLTQVLAGSHGLYVMLLSSGLSCGLQALASDKQATAL